MAGSGKFHHDPGRSRFMRFRDRAQSDWDDMLIGDFLRGQHGGRDGGFEIGQLDFAALFEHEEPTAPSSSESAIANAMLDAGVFEEHLFDDALPVEHVFDAFDSSLLDDFADEERAAIAAPLPGTPTARPLTLHTAAPVASKREIAPAGSAQEFSLRGFVQGFLIGAAFAGAALFAIHALI